MLDKDTQVHLVNNAETAYKLIQWIQEDHECIAYDLETTGLDARDDGARIRLAQLGDYRQGWAIPWDRWSGVFLEALDLWEGPLVGHNTSFDNRWLMLHAGWRPPFERLHDTMIMAQICEPDLNSGLKELSDRYIDPRASVGEKLLKQAMKEQGWDWSTVPADFDVYWTYGCIDTIITAHLWKHFRADVKYPAAYELEMNARRIVSAIEDNGIHLDVPYCEQKIVELHDYVNQSKQWAKDNWGINISAPAQVVDFFQNRLGQEFTIFTASGAPSASKDQLQKFIDNGYSAQDPEGIASQAASFIISTKQAQKKADSYFKNFLEFQHGGKLHTSFQTLRAKTGRMSSTRPALQTVSKQDAILRDAFIPPEGFKLLSCDYSQMELRMLGHFSGDKNLQEAFRKADTEGEDFFCLLGKNIFKDPNFTKKDPRRNIVKTTLYATIYGATPEKIAKTAGVPVDEIHDFLRELDSTYPGISEFQRQIITLGDQREREEGQGYVNTPNGRRIPCARGDSRVLVNYIIQGSSADIMKDALVRLDAAGYTDYLNLVIHDEVIACLPEHEFDSMSKDIEEIMSVMGKFSVDIPAERSDPYDRWGDKVRQAG